MSGTARVLVVDDDRTVSRVLARVLAAEGHEVYTAPDGEAALAQAAARPFDLVLLDMAMPRLDGLATLQRLRARGLEARVVMLSGHMTPAQTAEAYRLGAADVLPKPPDVGRLVALAREAGHPTPAVPRRSA
jgi:DNA-binding response OmpR family regulator